MEMPVIYINNIILQLLSTMILLLSFTLLLSTLLLLLLFHVCVHLYDIIYEKVFNFLHFPILFYCVKIHLDHYNNVLASITIICVVQILRDTIKYKKLNIMNTI